MASASPPEQPPIRPWPAVRAALIAGVLLVYGTIGGPWPDLSRSDLRYAVAQEELARWSGLLTEAGWELAPDELGERVLAVGQVSRELQDRLYGPIRPFLRQTGTGQAWGLFAYPETVSGRLVIGARQRGELDFRTLYRAPGQGEDWLVDLVEYRRVRGIYDDKGDRPKAGFIWGRLSSYLAARIMVVHPEVEEVELRFDLTRASIPGRGGERQLDRKRHVRRRTRQEVAEELAHLGAPPGSIAPPPQRSPVGP